MAVISVAVSLQARAVSKHAPPAFPGSAAAESSVIDASPMSVAASGSRAARLCRASSAIEVEEEAWFDGIASAAGAASGARASIGQCRFQDRGGGRLWRWPRFLAAWSLRSLSSPITAFVFCWFGFISSVDSSSVFDFGDTQHAKCAYRCIIPTASEGSRVPRPRALGCTHASCRGGKRRGSRGQCGLNMGLNARSVFGGTTRRSHTY